MNKSIILTVIITALVTFIVTAVLANSDYQGYDAQHWYEANQSTENVRDMDWNAITCVRGLGYTNFPNLEDSYDLSGLNAIDSAGNYYSKGQIDQCLYGL